MPAPTDRNALIALAKGWTRDEKPWFRTKPGAIPHYDRWLGEDLIEKEVTHWLNPEGKAAIRPDFVGTLEGVSGMLRELYEATDKVLEVLLMPFNDGFQCVVDMAEGPPRYFWSPWERFGDCVGDAYLSMKEAANDL